MAMAARVDAREQRGHQRIGRGRRLVGVPDAQPAAQVEVMQAHAMRLDRFDEIEHAVEGVEVRTALGDLRADVAIDAHDLDAGQRSRVPVCRDGALVCDAELVRLQARGDVRMRAGIDIGIHAQADAGRAACLRRHVRQRVELGFALDVEAHHAGLQRTQHLGACLADAREHDLRRGRARGERALELAERDDVEAAAGLGEGLQHREAGVRLHRIADQVIAARQRTLPRGHSLAHGRLRIGVQRRAELGGQRRQRAMFDVQRVAPVGDVR